ncbi:MAG: hypothetical protein AAGG75_27080 [Bacteroidota bacterium]
MKTVKMPLQCTLLLAMIILSGCARLNKQEIQSLRSTKVSPLALQPSYHLDEFRLDVIRQTTEDCPNDGIRSESDVPYHPMGFDLGNGLFFDMNRNLSFRVDQLFDINEDEDYVIEVKRGRRVSYRTKKDDEVCHQRNGFLGIKSNQCSRSEQRSDALRVFQNGRFRYEITTDDQTMYYARRSKKPIWSITQKDKDQYNIRWRKRKRKRHYRIEENTIVLDNHYRLVHNEPDNSIAIYRIGWKQDFLLYTIKKGKNKIMVYNTSNRGFKIELYNNQMQVFDNQHLQYEFKKLE